MRKPLLPGLCLLALAVGPSPTGGQEIPRDQYLRYVPLEIPRLVRQTSASIELHLYGNKDSPGYVDRNPVDGIDDRRHRVFQSLAVQFAPFLVQNTEMAPMSFKAISESGPFPLHIDTWNTATGSQLIKSESIEWLKVASDSCTPANPTSDDCRLLSLLEEYHPDRPASAVTRAQAVEVDSKPFQVLWVDMPGQDPKTWKQEFENRFSERLRTSYRGFVKTYVHPFLEEVPDPQGRKLYRLVLQYWFFYPYNDGGNNHEGDWEHLHVVVSPLNRITEPGLTAEEMTSLLDGAGLEETDERRLVIRRLDYYFHSKVAVLDFSDPNVYVEREDWEKQVKAKGKELSGIELFWTYIRGMAYEDAEETRINTHPVGYIGADNKGLDQLLAAPGGMNRDSHGTFPSPGLYKSIGPAGASELIGEFFDHKEFFASTPEEQQKRLTKFARGGVVFLGNPDLVEIVPDYERVVDLMEQSATVRQEWAWLVLPLRYGYPAVQSPFAGVVSHAETGNLSVTGPAFNTGWNRSGAGGQYKLYEPHVLSRLFPVELQDAFINDWGFLNATLPAISFLPPVDILWRVVAAPVRLAFTRRSATLFPSESVPLRFVGLNGGVSVQDIPRDYLDLLFNPVQFPDVRDALASYLIQNGADSTTTVIGEEEFIDDVVSPLVQVQLFIGDHFTTTNTIRHSRSNLGFAVAVSGIDDPFRLTTELNFWEYIGSLRYSIVTGGLQPYVKGGYGLSWYRLENTQTNGVPLPNPDSPWVRKPSIIPPENLLPNTWHIGLGFELILIKSYAHIPRGIDVSLAAEWLLFTNKLGLDITGVSIADLIGIGVAAEELPRERWVQRNVFDFVLTLSF